MKFPSFRRWGWTQFDFFLLGLACSIPVLLLFVFWISSACHAHDSWISRGGLHNPAGEWCCGKGDCGVLVAGKVAAIAGGYQIEGDFAIEQEGGPPIIDHVHEFIPYRDALPSPDGSFWRCKRPDGSTRCFFAGSPNG